MSSTDYTYDEQGQFFPYFVLTISGLITLPLTYNVLKPSKNLENTAPRINSDYKAPHDDLIQGQKRKQRRRERKLKRIVAALMGYVMMGWMIYLIIVTARTIPKIWDPYDILGISRSAGEDAIKKHYKKLSLKFHPDKIRPDPAKNETIETLNEYFVELTKAYKALTDEEVRNNYQQYGHPDGKQSYSIGIALPKFMVTEGNGKYVLLLYGVLLCILLPYLVGKWWYGTQRVTKERVLVASAGNLFREYKEDLSQGSIVAVLSSGDEYKSILTGNKVDAGLSTLEKRVLKESAELTNLSGLTSKDVQKLHEIEDPVRRKTLALLWAYLGRVELGNSNLEDEKYEVPPIGLQLNESFMAISLAFGNLTPILSSFQASQHLIQAIPPGGPSILQLPYVTPSIVEALQTATRKNPLSIRKFMAMPEAQRRKLCVDKGLLTSEQYSTATSVAKQLPYLNITKAFFKVAGEKVITPGSLVQFVVKGRFIPPGTVDIPEVNELDLEDIDPDEDDLDAILGRKTAKNRTAKNEDGEKLEAGPEAKSFQAPLAHAPFFARDHSPRWHVFLADSKAGKMAVPPFTFTGFEKPLFDESGKPTFNMQTLKMQFAAPPQVGKFQFTAYLICDSYIDLDSRLDVTLDVEDPAKAVKVQEEDDISEPEEDSLAGQMQAMRSGNVLSSGPTKSKKKRKPEEEESSDDESDTDGEAEDTSDTDTETDTDGE